MLVSTPSVFTLRKQDIKMIVIGTSGLWEQPGKVLKDITEDDC